MDAARNAHGDWRDPSEAARFAANLLVVGSALCLVVGITGRYWTEGMPAGWSYEWMIALSVGALTGGLILRVLSPKVSWPVILVVTPLATIYLGVGQLLTAGVPNFGPVLFLWPMMWAFVFLPYKAAVAQGGLALAVAAVILFVQEGWDPPLIYFFFLAGTIVVTSWMVSRLVRQVDLARAHLAELNDSLEQRVAEQVAEVARLERLRRFLSPSVAEVVLGAEEDEWLAPHRKEIAVVFCDLRGFTAFSTASEPEEVTDLLGRFHDVVGTLVDRYQATVGGFAGDGVLLYLNDPVPVTDPPGEAVRLALELMGSMGSVFSDWKARGYELGCGIGVTYGYATLGITGFDSRREYTAIGKVVNLASRLSDHAKTSEILIDQRTAAAVSASIAVESVGDLELKGFSSGVAAYRIDQRSADVLHASADSESLH